MSTTTTIDSFPQRKKDLFVTLHTFRLNNGLYPEKPPIISQENLDAMEHNRLRNIEAGSKWPFTDSEEDDKDEDESE